MASAFGDPSTVSHSQMPSNLKPKQRQQLEELLKIYDQCFLQVISPNDMKDWSFLDMVPKDACKQNTEEMSIYLVQIVDFILSIRSTFNQNLVSSDAETVARMRDTVFQLLVFLAAQKWNYFSETQRQELINRCSFEGPMSNFFSGFYFHSKHLSALQLDKTELCLCLSALIFEADGTEGYVRRLIHDYSSHTYGHAQPDRVKKIQAEVDVTRDLVRAHRGNRHLAEFDFLQRLSAYSDNYLILKTFYHEPKQNAF